MTDEECSDKNIDFSSNLPRRLSTVSRGSLARRSSVLELVKKFDSYSENLTNQLPISHSHRFRKNNTLDRSHSLGANSSQMLLARPRSSSAFDGLAELNPVHLSETITTSNINNKPSSCPPYMEDEDALKFNWPSVEESTTVSNSDSEIANASIQSETEPEKVDQLLLSPVICTGNLTTSLPSYSGSSGSNTSTETITSFKVNSEVEESQKVTKESREEFNNVCVAKSFHVEPYTESNSFKHPYTLDETVTSISDPSISEISSFNITDPLNLSQFATTVVASSPNAPKSSQFVPDDTESIDSPVMTHTRSSQSFTISITSLQSNPENDTPKSCEIDSSDISHRSRNSGPIKINTSILEDMMGIKSKTTQEETTNKSDEGDKHENVSVSSTSAKSDEDNRSLMIAPRVFRKKASTIDLSTPVDAQTLEDKPKISFRKALANKARPLSAIFMPSQKYCINVEKDIPGTGSKSKQSDLPRGNLEKKPSAGSHEAPRYDRSHPTSLLSKSRNFLLSHFSKKDNNLFESHSDLPIHMENVSQDDDQKPRESHIFRRSKDDTDRNSVDHFSSYNERRKKQIGQLDVKLQKEYKRLVVKLRSDLLKFFDKSEKLNEATSDGCLVKIINSALELSCVQDDIFEFCLSFTCKTKNPILHLKFCKKAFEILAKCCLYFSVSDENSDFFIYKIEKIYYEMADRKDYIKAAFIFNVLLKNISVVYGSSTHADEATLANIDQICKSHSCFDASFDEIMKLQAHLRPDCLVPWVMFDLCESILKNDGLHSEGIFRISADAILIDKLRKDMMIYKSPPTRIDANICASLLKSWFRDVKDGIFAEDCFQKCLESIDDPDMIQERLSELPKLHSEILAFLVRFIRLFMDPECLKSTKMAMSNMALVWSPNLLRCPYTQLLQISQCSGKQNSFISKVLDTFNVSFIDNIPEPSNH